DQAAHGQQRLAKQLLSISGELRSMADNSGPGMAADLAQQAASRVREAGRWLDSREPGQVATEVQSFARRRPAVFLLLAAGAGLVAGRLTRGLKGAATDDSTAAARPSDVAAYPSASTAIGAETASALPTPGDELGPVSGPLDPTVTPPDSRASVGELFSDVAEDLSTLMRQEVDLAKAELRQSATRAGKGAGLLAGAGISGHMVLLFASVAAWWGIGDATGHGWSALIVAAI